MQVAQCGVVIAAVTSTTVLSSSGWCQVSPNNGITSSCPSGGTTTGKPGTHAAGDAGVYVTASRRWFKRTDGAVENTTAMPVTHTVTVKRSETTEVKGEIIDGTLTTYLNQFHGFTTSTVSWELSQKVGPTTLLRTPRVVWSGDSSCWMLTPRMLAAADLTWHAVGAVSELTLSPGTLELEIQGSTGWSSLNSYGADLEACQAVAPASHE